MDGVSAGIVRGGRAIDMGSSRSNRVAGLIRIVDDGQPLDSDSRRQL